MTKREGSPFFTGLLGNQWSSAETTGETKELLRSYLSKGKSVDGVSDTFGLSRLIPEAAANALVTYKNMVYKAMNGKPSRDAYAYILGSYWTKGQTDGLLLKFLKDGLAVDDVATRLRRYSLNHNEAAILKYEKMHADPRSYIK